ncbi:hypothetical protein C7N43_26290 [Sphingobacteriales bacterium UPWRP_1]|nr:hypothetical protein B6N25_13830 [Sphingobacteriales bacterium TSM_CSS]PSJ73990.1 hypothetical protein C7N43_26290 [Sphingobacteriales bacterium UPWRP_1]
MVNKLQVLFSFIAGIILLGTQFIQAQNSEIGLWLGTGTYLGDLNPDYSFAKTRPAFGAIYRYTVNDYIMLKAGVSATRLVGNDEASKNPYQQARNLSFRSNLIELSGQIDLHFQKYIIGNAKHAFTPYLTTGLVLLYFNPRTTFEGETYNLHELGTEGQGNPDYTGRKPYKLLQPAIPLGGGIKYWMRKGWNFYVEIAYRQTFTDYLDDVSSTFADTYLIGDGTIAAELADRSDEVGDPIGYTGKQRGFITDKDGYLMTNVGITYTLFNRKCPKAK